MAALHSQRFVKTLALLLVCVWVVTGMAPPAGHLDWFLENMPAIFMGIALWRTSGRLRLSNWVYGWLFVHALILAYGGFYTYAKAPLGFWLQDLGHFQRNMYDRVGHFAQGFIPAFLFRELMLRLTPLQRGWALRILTINSALALSASYELLEGLVAYFVDSRAGDAFLGTQGDVWDTQWDMFCALAGALLATTSPLTRQHDNSLRALGDA